MTPELFGQIFSELEVVIVEPQDALLGVEFPGFDVSTAEHRTRELGLLFGCSREELSRGRLIQHERIIASGEDASAWSQRGELSKAIRERT